MTRDDLIEKMARAIMASRCSPRTWESMDEDEWRGWTRDAEMALAAIEAAGCRVVPIKMDHVMAAASWNEVVKVCVAGIPKSGQVYSTEAERLWHTMIAASPFAKD